MNKAFRLIENERIHQIEEGYAEEHDDEHTKGEIISVYAEKYIQRYLSSDKKCIEQSIHDLVKNRSLCCCRDRTFTEITKKYGGKVIC